MNRPIDRWVLPNGLRVVGERLPYLRSVSIGVWLHVGSMMELPRENGLSHFLEHMVFKGTEHRTARQIAEETDAVGAQLNAFTGKDCTCLYAKVIDEDLRLAVDILSDLAIHATLNAGEFEKERGVILEEIAMDEDSPEDLVQDVLSEAMFGGQSLGMPILGPAGQVAAYTRQDLFDYRATHYAPGRTVISLAGNYDPEEVGALMEEFFGAWRNDSPAPEPAPQHVLTGQTGFRVKDVEQLHLCLGYPGVPYGGEETYAMAVLVSVLGGSMSSRLFQRIREELGMAYSVYAYTNSYQNCGTMDVYAGVSQKNGPRVLEEIRREMDRLLRDGMTDKEFRDAVSQLRGGYLLGLESPGGRMQAMGRSMLLRDKLVSPQETLDHIEAVTYSDVMDLAARVFSAEPSLSAVGRNASEIRL